MFVFDGRTLFQFTGNYKELGALAVKAPARYIRPQTPLDAPSFFVKIRPVWAELQAQAAALGANAVMIRYTDSDDEGFIGGRHGGGLMERKGIVVADAVFLDGRRTELTTSEVKYPAISLGRRTQCIYPIDTKIETQQIYSEDQVTVTSIKGDQPRFSIGGTYLITGRYTLASADQARIKVFVTPKNGKHGSGRNDIEQSAAIVRGSGSFSLVIPVWDEGPLNVSISPAGNPLISPGLEDQCVFAIDPKVETQEFQKGDLVTVTAIRGDKPHIGVGGMYLISGNYTLASADAAQLAVFVTAKGKRSADSMIALQEVSIFRGSGKFTLAIPIKNDGRLHVSIYPAGSGKSLGGVYLAKQ
jgi:hypothetical protein